MKRDSSILKTILFGTTTTFLAISFMIFPKEAYDASVRGLTMWWDVVFPSLLPFFILSEFLIRFGVVSFIGALFEPIMRPLFRVPGSGSFVWAMGLASGFPAGAKLTARLRQEGKISSIEGERLVSFTNASNPLFIFGAISVGFFHDPALGIVLAAAHYVGNIIVGLAMRFYGNETPTYSNKGQEFSFKYAIKSMHEERLSDDRPLGKLMGDAVHSAIQTLLMIGGFIILFSVLNEILDIIHITAIVSFVISIVLSMIQMPNELSPAIIQGIFEITIGSDLVSQTQETSLIEKAIVTSFILAFNGLSVQAQVASILSETDIRFRPFFFARCFHGFVAAILTYFIFDWLYIDSTDSSTTEAVVPAFQNVNVTVFHNMYEFLLNWGSFITIIGLSVWILLLPMKSKTLQN
ncbi:MULTISPECIES: sporulation integral membrane protein YlbJ [Bacillaceae]|uniref:Sporulation integral membrane protein YlbJ n=1 Tax=Evansella alkalicola TaxID=745819 RepID=A0ABS6JRX5_9BACI|nr:MULTISPECIES: sporulation integral membrane protein YlbJ [Bacillaceae]MBU9720464.1 sporulation integral membrane protein YlbJ [Bacillus alkalicola]